MDPLSNGALEYFEIDVRPTSANLKELRSLTAPQSSPWNNQYDLTGPAQHGRQCLEPSGVQLSCGTHPPPYRRRRTVRTSKSCLLPNAFITYYELILRHVNNFLHLTLGLMNPLMLPRDGVTRLPYFEYLCQAWSVPPKRVSTHFITLALVP